MNSSKPWYLSKTIWASAVTIATALGAMMGLPSGVIDNGALTDTIIQAITAISGLIAIFGRVSAAKRIG